MLGIFFEVKDDATKEDRDLIKSNIDEIVKYNDLLRIGDNIIMGRDFVSSICSIHRIINELKTSEIFVKNLKSSFMLDINDYCPLTPLFRKG